MSTTKNIRESYRNFRLPIHGVSCVERGPHLWCKHGAEIWECCLGIWAFYPYDEGLRVELISQHDPNELFAIATKPFSSTKPKQLMNLVDLRELLGEVGPRWESDAACKNEGPHCEQNRFGKILLSRCCRRFWEYEYKRDEWVKRPVKEEDTFNGHICLTDPLYAPTYLERTERS